MKRNFREILTNDNYFLPNDTEYNRAVLLNLILILLLGIFSLYLGFNIFDFKSYDAAKIDVVCLLITACIFIYFHKTNNVTITSNIILMFIFSIFILILNISGNQYYFLVWILVFPIIIYFLIGSGKANRIMWLYFAFLLLFITIHYGSLQPVKFNKGYILNIFAATFSIIMLVSYYDNSRTVLVEKNNQLELLSITDSLTGLYNKTKLDQIISLEIERISRGGNKFSVIMIHIDHLNGINEKLGHIVGEDVLKYVSTVFKKSCRQLDIVGRWGDEEFLVICPETNQDGVIILANRMLQNLLYAAHKDAGRITMSVGISFYRSGDTRDTIIYRAYDALHTAKSNGGCQIEII